MFCWVFDKPLRSCHVAHGMPWMCPILLQMRDPSHMSVRCSSNFHRYESFLILVFVHVCVPH